MWDKMADITVTQTPVSVEITCDNCDEEISFDYLEFTKRFGEPYDWDYQEIECPHCGYANTVDSWEFD